MSGMKLFNMDRTKTKLLVRGTSMATIIAWLVVVMCLVPRQSESGKGNLKIDKIDNEINIYIRCRVFKKFPIAFQLCFVSNN